MLKITIHDSAHELRFHLEGKLSGPWVPELSQCWRTAQSTTVGRGTVVDLDNVDFISPEGESLLEEMHREGVRLTAATPLPGAIVEGIQRQSRCGTVEEKQSKASNVLFRHTVRPNSRAS